MSAPTPPPADRPGTLSYRDAGVDLDAAQSHTAAIAGLIAGGQTGFAAAHALPTAGMSEPMLVSCTDGVGTKVLLAQELGRTEGLGQDLVAMCVNDLVCTGARPLIFLDYLAVGTLEPTLAGGLVRSIAAGHFDLAGFACGVVDRPAMLGPQRVGDGDVIMGIPSSGIHSNGFSLVRALVDAGALEADADLLLEPTRLYVNEMRALQEAGVPVRAAAHITGGGLPENLPRALPAGWGAVLDAASWERGAAFDAILAGGRVAPDDAWRTFNMGLGLCVIVPADAATAVQAVVADARPVGRVDAELDEVRIDGA